MEIERQSQISFKGKIMGNTSRIDAYEEWLLDDDTKVL